MQAVLKESTSGSSNFGRMQELLPHEAIEPTIDKDEIEAALEYQMSPARWTQPRTRAEDQNSHPIQNEDLFYGMNRAVKGKSVTSQSQKKLLQTSQVEYFNN